MTLPESYQRGTLGYFGSYSRNNVHALLLKRWEWVNKCLHVGLRQLPFSSSRWSCPMSGTVVTVSFQSQSFVMVDWIYINDCFSVKRETMSLNFMLISLFTVYLSSVEQIGVLWYFFIEWLYGISVLNARIDKGGNGKYKVFFSLQLDIK